MPRAPSSSIRPRTGCTPRRRCWRYCSSRSDAARRVDALTGVAAPCDTRRMPARLDDDRRGESADAGTAAPALERDPRAAIKGEVRFDAKAGALYATDASPYRIVPIGVVVPLDDDDLRAAVRIATEHHTPILMRAGGTSLAGQTVARALVIDVSKHMTKVLDLDVDGRRVRVQPGLVRDQLNRQ